MSATFDTTGTNNVSLGTTVAVTLTVGSGANRAVMVGLGFGVHTATGISVTGAGASGWALVSGTDTGAAVTRRTLIWAASNPSTGLQTVTATWTGSADCVMGVVTAAGVNQTTPVVNGTNQTQLSATSDALIITSKAGDLTMDAVAVLATLSAPTQTQRWLDNTLTTVDSGGSTGAGAATVSHGWTSSIGTDWAHSGADFSQASPAEDDPLDLRTMARSSTPPPTVQIALTGVSDDIPAQGVETEPPPVRMVAPRVPVVTVPLIGVDDAGAIQGAEDDPPPARMVAPRVPVVTVPLIGTSDEPAPLGVETEPPPWQMVAPRVPVVTLPLIGTSDEPAPAPAGVEEGLVILAVEEAWLPEATLAALRGTVDVFTLPSPVGDESMAILAIDEWEAQLGHTVWYDESGGVVLVPPPPGIGLRVLLRGLGLAPVYGSLAELAPSGIVYALLQFDAFYPAGGYPLTPQALGFTTKALTFLPTKALVTSQGYFPVYDGANRTVRLFRAVAGQWVEPSAGTDLSRVVMDVAVAGY